MSGTGGNGGVPEVLSLLADVLEMVRQPAAWSEIVQALDAWEVAYWAKFTDNPLALWDSAETRRRITEDAWG